MLSSTFHDERLISISVADDTLAMEVSEQDKSVKIKISDLEKLRVTDFKEGNIINAIRTIKPDPSESSEVEIKSLLMYAYELDDESLKMDAKLSLFIDKKLKEHTNGSIIILEVEPSYGAYLVAIGKTISEENAKVFPTT